METLIQIIFISAVVKFCLKVSFGCLRALFSYAFFAAVWGMILYPFVISQPVSIVTSFLRNKPVVADGAVLTTIEAIAGILLSVNMMDDSFTPEKKRKKSVALFRIVPGALFFPAVGYFELMFFKWRVGGDFVTTSILYALLTGLAVFLLSWLFSVGVRGENLKLEMNLLLNVTILFTGLLINASVADYNVSGAENTIEWMAMIVLFFISLLLFVAGVFFSRIRIKNIFK